jgi:hypothetical protein
MHISFADVHLRKGLQPGRRGRRFYDLAASWYPEYPGHNFMVRRSQPDLCDSQAFTARIEEGSRQWPIASKIAILKGLPPKTAHSSRNYKATQTRQQLLSCLNEIGKASGIFEVHMMFQLL